MPGGFIGQHGSSAGAPLVEGEGVSGRMGFDLNISNDDRYEDAPRERNAGGASLEDMMRLRMASQKTQQIT